MNSLPNFRDVGGYTTRDGMVVRSGVAYRSGQLNSIAPEDMKRLTDLGLKTVFDLRTEDECNRRPDEMPSSVKRVTLNLLADSDGVAVAKIQKLLSDPSAANKELGGGKATQLVEQVYREFVTLPSANAALHDLIIALGHEAELPSLYHCTTGKDRTGWATAALLTLLGVPQDKVLEDFLRSNDYVLPAYQSFIERFVANGGEKSIVIDIVGVKKEYLQAAFNEMESRYGSIEAYFEKGLGIDEAGQQRLRDRLLASTS